MTEPVEGSGSVRTYLSGTPARARVQADFYPTAFAPPPDQLEVPSIEVDSVSFDLEDYLVIDGVPTGQAPVQCRMQTRVGLGAWLYTDTPPAPGDINIGATARWLPYLDTFVEGEGWSPAVGGGFSLATAPESTPYLDRDYSFEVRGGDEVRLPAVVFSGDAFMTADDPGWTANAFTMCLVAVLHPNQEGPNYGLIESERPVVPDDDDDPYVDWGLRYSGGQVRFFAGGQVLSHQVSSPQARPIVLLVSLDAENGRLLVADKAKSTRSFATGGMRIYDMQLLVGRTGGVLNRAETAVMDVLEIAYWDRGLDFAEMAEVLHDLDSIYGVMG